MGNAQISSVWAPLALFSFSLSRFLYTYIQRPCRYHIGLFCAVMGPFYPRTPVRGIRAGASIPLIPMAQPFPFPFTFYLTLLLSSSPFPSLSSLPLLSLPLSPPLPFVPILPSSEVAVLNSARRPGERCKHQYPRHNSRLLVFRPLLSKTVNRSPRIYNNRLKFFFFGFLSSSCFTMAHIAPCLTLTGRPQIRRGGGLRLL